MAASSIKEQQISRQELDQYLKGTQRSNKYNARKVQIDGFTFDSILESKVYREILGIHEKGLISDVILQYEFPLHGKLDRIVCSYRADFYATLSNQTSIVIEAKGVETDTWKIKKALFSQQYQNIPLLIIKEKNLPTLEDSINGILYLSERPPES